MNLGEYMTKEEAKEFLNKLDPYSKYGKTECVEDVGISYKEVSQYKKPISKTDGQFCGGYRVEIYKLLDSYFLIYEISPDGIPFRLEFRKLDD